MAELVTFHSAGDVRGYDRLRLGPVRLHLCGELTWEVGRFLDEIDWEQRPRFRCKDGVLQPAYLFWRWVGFCKSGSASWVDEDMRGELEKLYRYYLVEARHRRSVAMLKRPDFQEPWMTR